MREHLNTMQEEVTKKMMSFYPSQRVDEFSKETETELTEEDRKKMIEMLKTGSYKLNFTNASHLRFMIKCFGFDSAGFTNMFYGHKWKIYLAKGEKRFITTDNPVVEWWLPPKNFYTGGSFLERNKYFALTPEVLIELTYPIGGTKIKRTTLFKDDDEKVDMLNLILIAHSHEFAYAQDKSLLEALHTRRNNPGKLERRYYNIYQKPWDEARRMGKVQL